MTPPSFGAAACAPSQLDAASPTGEDEAQAQVHELYRAYSPTLVRQLTRATGCREIARDLVHETFVRLMRQAPGMVAKIERPEAYLRRISQNLLRDWGRSRKIAENSKAALEVASETSLDQVAVLETRETLRHLEAALARLSPRTRDIFIAHRLEGLSYAEIAQLTGLGIRGVEWQISKAIAKLDRMLDRD